MLQNLRVKLSKLPRGFLAALLCAELFAVLWWLAALYLRSHTSVPVWFDQERTFTQLGYHLSDPYSVGGFVNPPWTAILLAPFALPTLPISTLIQICIYFALLTGIVYKYAGKRRGKFAMALIVVTSFFAFDSAIELNIEWLVCLGLLVPPLLSGPLLLIKPQDVLGVMLSFKRRDVIRTGIVTLGVVILSFVLWGNWITPYHDALIQNSYAKGYNLAPSAIIGWIPALGIGLLLAYIAFRRRDPMLSVLAWLFFVPYTTLYALLVPFSLLVVRFPRVGLIITVSMWIIYGGVVLLALR